MIRYSKVFKLEHKFFNEVKLLEQGSHPFATDEENTNNALSFMLESLQIVKKEYAEYRLEAFEAEIKNVNTHIYFQSQNLKKFLASIKKVDLVGVRDFLLNKSEEIRKFSSLTTMDSVGNRKDLYSFAFHIPNDQFGYVVSIALFQGVKGYERLNGAVFISLVSDKFTCFINIPPEKENLDFDKEFGQGKHTGEFKLAINTLIYMFAFPDKLSDKLPHEMTAYPKNSLYLGVSDKVIHSNKTSGKGQSHKAPHFRSGHFRYLASDYYKNKKGQWTFVSPSAIGQAKALLE